MTTTKPSDHVQPKDQPQTITVDGVKLTISPDIFDDLNMMENLYRLQHTEDADNAFALIPFLMSLCGDQYTAVKNKLRDPETGRIPLDKVSDFVMKLMQELNPNS